jgi:hypothetical protein
MALMLHWMDNDLDLLERWGNMFRTEPSTQGRNHAPPGDMIAFIEAAIQLRVDRMAPYMDHADIRRIGYVPHSQWAALEHDTLQLMARGVPPQAAEAAAAALRRNALLDTLTSHDPQLRRKLFAAWASEPLLQAGAPLSAPVRDYLESSFAFVQQNNGKNDEPLDPHVT